MSNEPLPDFQQNGLHEAAQWRQKLKDEALDPRDRELLRAWLCSPQNMKELARIFLVDSLLQGQLKGPPRESLANVIHFKPYVVARSGSSESKNLRVDQSPPVSIFYLQNFSRKNWWAKVAVAAAGLFTIFLAVLVDPSWLAPGVACMLCLGAILSKEAILSHRVRRGSFGSTESEVRDLIKFIVESDEFSDGNGRRRPALVAAPRDGAARSDHLPIGARTQ
jgi:hypothetical protein